MPKRPCTQRANWRLLRGQRPQHLSAHYQLECDFGTRLIAIYKEGDPVFLCEDHRSAIAQSDDNCIAGVRSIRVDSVDSSHTPKNSDLADTPPPVVPRPSAPAPKPSAPASPEGTRSVALKVGRETIDPPSKEFARDLTYGDGAKALVDETIWNMETGDFEVYSDALRQGKTAIEAAQAAGGQLAVIHRKISEYTQKIEAILSESKPVISVGDIIEKPLERAMLEIIGKSTISDTEKDIAIDHLGAFQEKMNRGLNREITPLQAHRIAHFVAESACWGATSCLSEELKPAYRAVYTSVRNAIRAALPQAHDLDERLANLHAAKSDLENLPAAKASYALPA